MCRYHTAKASGRSLAPTRTRSSANPQAQKGPRLPLKQSLTVFEARHTAMAIQHEQIEIN